MTVAFPSARAYPLGHVAPWLWQKRGVPASVWLPLGANLAATLKTAHPPLVTRGGAKSVSLGHSPHMGTAGTWRQGQGLVIRVVRADHPRHGETVTTSAPWCPATTGTTTPGMGRGRACVWAFSREMAHLPTIPTRVIGCMHLTMHPTCSTPSTPYRTKNHRASSWCARVACIHSPGSLVVVLRSSLRESQHRRHSLRHCRRLVEVGGHSQQHLLLQLHM